MYSGIFSHTQLTLLRMFIIWQLVLTSSIGRYEAIVQEHEHIQKLSTTTSWYSVVSCDLEHFYTYECYTNRDASYKVLLLILLHGNNYSPHNFSTSLQKYSYFCHLFPYNLQQGLWLDLIFFSPQWNVVLNIQVTIFFYLLHLYSLIFSYRLHSNSCSNHPLAAISSFHF